MNKGRDCRLCRKDIGRRPPGSTFQKEGVLKYWNDSRVCDRCLRFALDYFSQTQFDVYMVMMDLDLDIPKGIKRVHWGRYLMGLCEKEPEVKKRVVVNRL